MQLYAQKENQKAFKENLPNVVGRAMFFSACMLIVYLIIMLFMQIDFNGTNLFIVFVSAFAFVTGIIDLKKYGITISNVFRICFFGILILNSFNLSGLQREKTIIDAYYYLFGPILFAVAFKIYEKSPKVKILKGFCVNADMIALVIVLLCVVTKLRIFLIVGFRVFSNSWSTAQTEQFVMQGDSGVASMFMWLSLMMVPVIKRRWLKICAIAVPIMCAFLSASRGDFMRMAIYLLVLWIACYGSRFFSRKNIIKLSLIAVILIVLFSVWGSYRQQKRGWSEKTTMGYLLNSRTDNEVINWAYGYTGINFDVLKQEYIEGDITNEFKALLVPLMRLTGGSSAVESYYKSVETKGLNGFNASTFLANFVKELGMLYFIDIILLAMMIIVLDMLALSVRFVGGHLFIIMMTALTIFGNYYINVNMFFSIIIGIFIYFIVDISDGYNMFFYPRRNCENMLGESWECCNENKRFFG